MEDEFELFGVPIPHWLGEFLEEVLDVTVLTALTWMTVGLVAGAAALLLGLYLSWT